jgi:hypothetical protein
LDAQVIHTGLTPNSGVPTIHPPRLGISPEHITYRLQFIVRDATQEEPNGKMHNIEYWGRKCATSMLLLAYYLPSNSVFPPTPIFSRVFKNNFWPHIPALPWGK